MASTTATGRCRDAATGKYHHVHLFVMTLACSRKAARLLTANSSAKTWAQLHESAFRRLGGAVQWVVFDNLHEGVLKPDVHEPCLTGPLPA